MDHPCLWNMKHCACGQEHLAEWLHVVVFAAAVELGVRIIILCSLWPPHSVYASSG